MENNAINVKIQTVKKIPFCPITFTRGYLLEVKDKIIEMALNESGIRDTSRVLKVSQNTVISELKKRKFSPK